MGFDSEIFLPVAPVFKWKWQTKKGLVTLGFVKSETVCQKVQKKKKIDSVIKWFSKYFLTLFFKMMLWKPNLKIFTCQRRELKFKNASWERNLSMFLVPFLSWLYGQ